MDMMPLPVFLVAQACIGSTRMRQKIVEALKSFAAGQGKVQVCHHCSVSVQSGWHSLVPARQDYGCAERADLRSFVTIQVVTQNSHTHG
jgi:hypothetical protein